MKRHALAALAYLVPTFALGFVWHLVIFDQYYKGLAIYRPDILVPFGFASIAIQGVVFGWAYVQLFARRPSVVSRIVAYGLGGAILSWSFTTLAVAAKNIMSSVPDYLLIESAFTAAQWGLVAPLTVLVTRKPSER